MAAIRQLYSSAVQAAETAWDSAVEGGMPDVPAALQTVEGLADAVSQNRTALMALTAMRNYDNYTFTHMVNVSILTMGQARALGIEGRLLREFGLSALMHDIGKVRTPKGDSQQARQADRRRVRDHAEAHGGWRGDSASHARDADPRAGRRLRTSSPPRRERLPVRHQAFFAERSDVLCSIADVYDAMRSQRAYQQAFPTDRILAVLQRSDGKQFDQHLVRRFVQLLGIYPPGNLVKLSSGEVAVVLKVHAPDPYRPRVRVLFDESGTRADVPYERNLFESMAHGPPPPTVVAPLDPAAYGVDPLNFMV